MGRAKQSTLFGGERLGLGDSISMTIESLRAYGERYDHWAVAFSGGKDSTTLVTLIAHLIRTGRIKPPKRLTICYADTRMELPPLAHSAALMLERLRADGFETRVAIAPMDRRFLVYMLGRGVPPPNNSTFRWCTRQIKVEPMVEALEEIAVDLGYGRFVESAWGPIYRSFDADAYEADPEYVEISAALARSRRLARKSADPASDAVVAILEADLKRAADRIAPGRRRILMLTGVRVGESAARDGRIALSCGKNGSECGQGWYQETLPSDLCDTLAPILHWRTCLVWDWLSGMLDADWRHGYPTGMVAEAYGLHEDGSRAEAETRTGCNGCPLATVDSALDNLLRVPKWSYLAPLKGLRPIYRWLREPAQRLRKPGSERMGDGSLKPTNRMGPITLEARENALRQILEIQWACNEGAADGMPRVDMLDSDEVGRIIQLIRDSTWPDRWSGDEPTADRPFRRAYADGSLQSILFSEGAT